MKKLFLMLFVTAIVFSSCSTYNYYAVSHKPLDRTKYKTFAWIPEQEGQSPQVCRLALSSGNFVPKSRSSSSTTEDGAVAVLRGS